MTPVAAQVSIHVYFATLWTAEDLSNLRLVLRARWPGPFVRKIRRSIWAFFDAQLLRAIRRYVMNFVATGKTANLAGAMGIRLLERMWIVRPTPSQSHV